MHETGQRQRVADERQVQRPAGDRFESGTYRSSGNDGAGSFDLAFSLSVGAGIEVSRSAEGQIIILPGNDPRRLAIGNVAFADKLGTRWRGAFRNGASFRLKDFFIRTGTESRAEGGNVIISIPVHEARITNTVLNVLTVTDQQLGVLDANLRYIRGDFLREPVVSVAPERRFYGIGEEVRVTVAVRNDSTVDIDEGEVALDLGGLRGVLTAGSTVRTCTRTPSIVTRELTFTFEAGQVGTTGLRFQLRGGWVAPVPAARRYERTIEMPGVIEVTADAPPLFRDGFERQEAATTRLGFERR